MNRIQFAFRMEYRVILLLLSLLLISPIISCSAQTNVKDTKQLESKHIDEHNIPDLFAGELTSLKQSPLPVILPTLLPSKRTNPGDYLSVKVNTDSTGYELTIYSDNDNTNKESGIVMAAKIANFSGELALDITPDQRLEALVENMNYRKNLELNGKSVTYYSESETMKNVIGSDRVTWEEGNWKFTAQGNPNDIHLPINDAPEGSTIEIAGKVMSMFEFPDDNHHIKAGYIFADSVPRGDLTVIWTYDDLAWYSVWSNDWEYLFKVLNNKVVID